MTNAPDKDDEPIETDAEDVIADEEPGDEVEKIKEDGEPSGANFA